MLGNFIVKTKIALSPEMDNPSIKIFFLKQKSIILICIQAW